MDATRYYLPEFDQEMATTRRVAAADCKSREELLSLFDGSVLTARKAIAAATEAGLDTPWTLRAGSHTIFSAPRWSVFRGFGMNHMIHHRAQLSVYLRLLDVPVPGIYGPTADEQ